ncbi:hypothetical protein ACFL3C_01275 [Patescibacteria group bacterium]
MKNKINSIVYVSAGILIGAPVLLFLWISSSYPLVEEVVVNDVVGEMAAPLILLVWFLVIQKLSANLKIYLPFIVGLILFLLGAVVDVLDEIYQIGDAPILPQVENVGIPFGLAFASLGLYFWANELKQTAKELTTNKKNLAKKNAELKETMEDLYELKTNMEKDIQDLD